MNAKTFADYGIEFYGDDSRTTCPQCSPNRTKKHDRCLSVDREQGVWFCHHCAWAGGLGGRDADAQEARRIFSKPVYVESGIDDDRVIAWFAKRGISTQTLADFKIKSGTAWMHGKGDADSGMTNTIQFPFYFGGDVVNVKYRTGDKRFRQEKNAKKCLYNFDNAMRANGDTLVITEGEMDCLTLHEVGYRAVVSVPDGAPSADTQNYTSKFDFLSGAEPLFERFKWVVLAVDGDAPGKRLEEELSRRIGIERCKQVLWPEGCKDANDVLVTKGAAMLRQVVDGSALFPVKGVATVDDLWNAVHARHAKPEIAGVDIGWPNGRGVLNIELGQMTVVTGIPSHGKSTWVDALRVNLWRNFGWASAAFSPENWPADDHLATLCEMYAVQHFHEMTTEQVSTALTRTLGAFFFIQPDSDSEMMTVDEILSRARSLVYRHGIKVLVIDPWNEVDHDIPNTQREDQYISTQLAKIRRFARMNAVHIFVICHPTKLVKDKDGGYPPPTPYDIAGGAMWRNKADNCLCVFRPDIKASGTEVLVQKIRFRRNGKAGEKMEFTFHVGTSTYHPKSIYDVTNYQDVDNG
jgi:twinkle protein